MPISDQIVDVQADVHIPFRMCNLIGLSGLFVLFLLIWLCVTNSALCGDYTAVHVSGIFYKIL